jgi:hypothetical protein
MHLMKRTQLVTVHFAVAVLFLIASSVHVAAQDGWNAAVHSTSGTVSPSASYAIVDATRFSGNDLCAMINNVFTYYYPGIPTAPGTATGVVIDARAVTALTCSAVNPWANLIAAETKTETFSNTVLLPAGAITIQQTWVLPPFTHLIGQGPNTTVIYAASGLGSNVDMIDMGAESSTMFCWVNNGDCPGIVIEHLGLVGYASATAQNGIGNCCAQELSRVNDVSISTVATGLVLSDRFSQNSGPYTNLTISGVNTCLAIGPAMSPVNNKYTMVNSRGVHGLTCSANGSSPAIKIDGPSNSLEDISISISGSSPQDGIRIGYGGPAQGNTLFNIQGSGSGLKNIIHVTSMGLTGASGAQNCPYTGTDAFFVCDLTIFGVAGTATASTVQDDLTGTTVKDSTLAMYVLGENVGTSSSYFGYSRFTTATATTNTYATPWLVGATGPTGSNCAVGAIYSCTGTCGTGTLFECTGGGSAWKKIQ